MTLKLDSDETFEKIVECLIIDKNKGNNGHMSPLNKETEQKFMKLVN